jgi:hypothetical protein
MCAVAGKIYLDYDHLRGDVSWRRDFGVSGGLRAEVAIAEMDYYVDSKDDGRG